MSSSDNSSENTEDAIEIASNSGSKSVEKIKNKKSSYKPSYLFDSEANINILLQDNYIGHTNATKMASELFLALCKTRKEIIYWKDLKFILTFDYKEQNAETFKMAIKTIENIGLFVLRSIIIDGNLTEYYIRLCDPKSREFYSEFVTEMVLHASTEVNLPLPYKNEISKNGIVIPNNMLTNFANLREKIQLKAEQDFNNTTIYFMELNSSTLYFTEESFFYLPNIAIERLKNLLSFAGTELFTQLSRIANVDQNELQMSLSNKDMRQLLTITETLESQRDKILSNPHINKYPDFHELIKILYNVLPAMLHFEEYRTEASNNARELSNILLQKAKEQKVFTKFQFESYLKQSLEEIYGNDRDQIHDQGKNFLKKFTALPEDIESIDSDIIVDFDTYYIYARHIKFILLTEYEKIRKQYIDILSKEIKKFLLGKTNASSKPYYFKKYDLEVSIKQFLFKKYPAYYMITRHPDLIWIAMHSRSTVNSELTQTTLLSAFFKSSDVKTLLPWTEILRINLKSIHIETYSHLNLMAKLIVFFKKSNQKFYKFMKN